MKKQMGFVYIADDMSSFVVEGMESQQFVCPRQRSSPFQAHTHPFQFVIPKLHRHVVQVYFLLSF